MRILTRFENRQETLEFLDGNPSICILSDYIVPEGYRLLCSPTTETKEGLVQTIRLIYFAKGVPETVYMIKTLVRKEINAYLVGKKCMELLVWKAVTGLHESVQNGFARKVINHLLTSHNIVITDKHRTESFKRFWLDRMSESLALEGQELFYINLDNDEEPIVDHIESLEDFLEIYVPLGWGNESKNKVFVISEKENG